MPKLTLNSLEIEFEEGLTLIQVCEQAGVEIPRFCYHEKLSIAGNCRMCLVEVENSPKLVASCALAATDGMVIRTNTEKVKKARSNVIELLLINHPLDCPICDQGGECDLQDQALAYGKGHSRFNEGKRSVKDKNMGPLIKTHMTRCIHCTRCIRFMEEIAGIEEIGVVDRGEKMEITTLEKAISSELSGNLIDICPVGALTSRPYASHARPWELVKVESIDVLDALGSNIRLDVRGNEILRVLPRINEEINGEWISDKTRFSYDGLKRQRLDRPYLKENQRFYEVSWDRALSIASSKISSVLPEEIAVIAGTMADCESLFTIKQFMDQIGCKNIDINQFGYKFDTTARGNYLFNTTIAGVDLADLFLFIGTDIRRSSPVLNARIGQVIRQGAYAARIGEADDQTYYIDELGPSLSILEDIVSGTHSICAKLKAAKKPVIIIGDSALSHQDFFVALDLIHKIIKKYNIVSNKWNGFNILHNHASTVGGLDLGFFPPKGGKNTRDILKAADNGEIKVVYLLNADDIDTSKLKNTFVIYQGHHGDRGAQAASLILPACAYTEKKATYINMEGRSQRTRIAASPPGLAREDWTIINDIAIKAGYDLGLDNIDELWELISNKIPAIKNLGMIEKNEFQEFSYKGSLSNRPLVGISESFYISNVVSRASKTMAECERMIERKTA